MKFLSAISNVFATIGKSERGQFSKGYDAVKEPFSRQRREAYVERAGEDKQLSTEKRNKIINLHRDLLRNAPESVSQDQQVRVNVVGCVGGKMFASFGDAKDAAAEVMRYFNRRWCRHADFTYGKHFNEVLKTILTAQATNGNVVLVFDDGILTGGNGTGRVRGFEGDEIASVPKTEFEKHFPKTYVQSEGFVYNESGMFCGCFVSTSQRGKKTFAPQLGYITLKFDPFDDETIPNWIALGDMRRFNQGRAIPPGVSALTTAVDLHETRASEAQAAKLNAQMVGQILKTEDDGSPSGTDAGGAFSGPSTPSGTGSDEGTAEVRHVKLKNLKAIGAKLDEVPFGRKIELFDTKRPNPNFPAYAEYMQGVTAAVRGLPRVYATLKVQNSYTGYRGEQKIAEQSFMEAQKQLEREVCDWAACLAISRAIKIGIIKATLPEDWRERIAWQWPKLPEVSVKEAESGRKLKLENGVTSLTRELGPGEVDEIIAERKREKELFDQAGLVYPGETTESGQIKGDTDGDDDDDDEIDGEISDEEKQERKNEHEE